MTANQQFSFGPGTLHDAQGRLLGHVAASAPVTYPAPTAASWGSIICAWVPVDRRGPRTTPKQIRRFRYVRRFHRRRLRSWGGDTGLWFHGILVVHFDREATNRAEASA